MALQFRRGSETNRTSITPASGEPIWITDTQRLYVGDGVTAGGVLAGGGGGTSTVTNQLLFTTSSVIFSEVRTTSDRVRLGTDAGSNTTGSNIVAIGYQSALNTQSNTAIAIGFRAGQNSQGEESIAIGREASYQPSGRNSISMGTQAGYTGQSTFDVAIGTHAGYSNQADYAVAIGTTAGYTSQGTGAVAVGNTAGYNQQSVRATAVGQGAGENYQGYESTALGFNAGRDNLGQRSIAIGCYAGIYGVANNAIVLKASGPFTAALTTVTNSGFYVDPIRTNNNNNVLLCYNTATYEIVQNTSAVLTTAVSADNQTGTVTLDSWSTSTYQAAKYQVSITAGGDLHVLELLAGHSSGSTYKTEYAILLSNSEIATFSTDIDAGNFRLRATSTSTFNVRLNRTLINI